MLPVNSVIIEPWMSVVGNRTVTAVFAYLYRWTKNRRCYHGTQADIAKALGCSVPTVKRATAQLIAEGWITWQKMYPSGGIYTAYAESQKREPVEPAEPPKKTQNDTDTKPERQYQNDTDSQYQNDTDSQYQNDTDTAPHTLLTYINNNRDSPEDDKIGDEKNEVNEEKPIAPLSSFFNTDNRGAILEAYRDTYYQLTHANLVISTWTYVTNAASEITTNIVNLAKFNKLPTSYENVKDYATQFFIAAYAVADDFIRNNWELPVISKSFSSLYTAVKNHRPMQSNRNTNPAYGTTQQQLDELDRQAASAAQAIADLLG